MATTIKISDETHTALGELKLHPREPYGDVVARLVKIQEPQTFCGELAHKPLEDTL